MSTEVGDDKECGSLTVEAVIIVPLIIIVLLFVVGAVRLVHSRSLIDQAADQAAIAAADAGPGSGDGIAAQEAAAAILKDAVDCRDPVVAVAAGPGAYGASSVTTTVSCAVPLSDLVISGFPGHRTVTARATVPRSLYAVDGQGP